MKSCFIEKAQVTDCYQMMYHHVHPYYETYFLTEGKRTIFIGDNKHELSANDLLLIPAKLKHRTEGVSYTRYLVNFNKEYLNEKQLHIVEHCEQQKISLTHEEATYVIKLIELMKETQENWMLLYRTRLNT